MKNLKKIFAALVVVLVGVMLSSCSKYDFYKDWSKAGATIEKDNIFEVISLDDAKAKIDNDETFILVCATSASQPAVTDISVFQQQAEYLGFEGVVYFINAADHLTNKSTRDNIKNTLGIHDINVCASSHCVSVLYSKGEILIDTSDIESANMANYKNGNALNILPFVTYALRDFDLNN